MNEMIEVCICLSTYDLWSPPGIPGIMVTNYYTLKTITPNHPILVSKNNIFKGVEHN